MYVLGSRFITVNNIYKKDIDFLCLKLNNQFLYRDYIHIYPHKLYRGYFSFKYRTYPKYIKSFILDIPNEKINWYNLYTDDGNNNVIIYKNTEFNTFMQNLHGASNFTFLEKDIWIYHLQEIGIIELNIPKNSVLNV